MGAQELLKIGLVVIVVGIAVLIGIFLFKTHAMHAHRQSIVAQMNQIMVEALAYSKLPTNLGGGGGGFWNYIPEGGESFRGHIGNPPNQGFKVTLHDVNYFVEIWVPGAYPQRVKIIASSLIYGEGNYWPNTYNARILASYDADGKVMFTPIADRNGIIITGDWNR